MNLARERGGDSIGCISTDGMFSSSADRLALTRTALLRRPHPDRQQPLQVYEMVYTVYIHTLVCVFGIEGSNFTAHIVRAACCLCCTVQYLLYNPFTSHSDCAFLNSPLIRPWVNCIGTI